MATGSLDKLLKDMNETFDRIEALPKHHITPDLDLEIGKWKDQIAQVCLPLVLESSESLPSSSLDAPDNDCCIHLQATSHLLPRRLEGQLKPIDTHNNTKRVSHEAEIEHRRIVCYRAREGGKLVPFEPCSTSLVHKVLGVFSIPRQLYSFSFPQSTQLVVSTYSIKYCAHPACGKPVEGEEDHLQLYRDHHEGLKSNTEDWWLPGAANNIYNAIRDKGQFDSKGIHNRIYYQLLPQLDAWMEQIDQIISVDCTGTGVETSSVDAWLVLQLRPVRQLLMLMKSIIFVYRMHLDQQPLIISATIALIVFALQSNEVRQAIVNGFVRIIRTVCGTLAAIFAYVGIDILYTFDLIFTDDAYIAIILQAVGAGLVFTGAAAAIIAAAPAAIVGGIGLTIAGIASFLVGTRMGRERDRRGEPHAHLIQVHLDLRRARERLWQWIE